MKESIVYNCYFDGSCGPTNPNGEIGVGAVIYAPLEIWNYSKMYPAKKGNTNNMAEYMAFIAVLDYFIKNWKTKENIVVWGDSQIVVNQMRGAYKIRSGAYVNLALEAKEKIKMFSNLNVMWCPREQNKRADYLSNPSQK